MLKKFISSIILICFLAPTYQAFAFNDSLTSVNVNEKIIEGSTIPRLEDNGESLQYSKEDLSSKLIDSELEIESFNINSNNQVSIEGSLHYSNNESKDFMLTGELQNSLEENKEKFNVADMEDVLWIGKVLNISKTSLIELPEENISTLTIPSSHTETIYIYNNSYTFFGHNYKDSIGVFLQLLYPNYLPNESTFMGYAKILVYSNTSKNLTTRAQASSSSILIGKDCSSDYNCSNE